MTRHPCFICEDVGSFEYRGVRHSCCCEASKLPKRDKPEATQTSLPTEEDRRG